MDAAVEQGVSPEPKLEKEIFDGYEGSTVVFACGVCDAKTEHMVLRGIGYAVYDPDGYCPYERYEQICQCTCCGGFALREVSGSDEFFEEGFDSDLIRKPIEELVWPPRAITEDLIDGVEQLPAQVLALYRSTVSALAAENWVMAELGLFTLLEAIWHKLDEPGLTMNDCVAVWAARGWLDGNEADRLNGFVQYQLRQAKAYLAPERLSVWPALTGVEIMLQRVFLGATAPISSLEKVARRELAQAAARRAEASEEEALED